MQPERTTVLHSWCRQSEWSAPTIVGGSGARLHTADGRRILDMSSLAECSNLGHQHPHVIAAIRAQAEQLCFVDERVGRAAARAARQMIAGEVGLRGRPRVLHARGRRRERERGEVRPSGLRQAARQGHHARSLVSRRKLRDDGAVGRHRTRHQVDPVAFGVVHAPPPYAYRCPFGSSSAEECGERSVQHIGRTDRRARCGQVAAVIMEPNAGTNGIVAPRELLAAVATHTRNRMACT